MSAVAAVRRPSRKCDSVNFLFAKHYDSLGIIKVNREFLSCLRIVGRSCYEAVNIVNPFRLTQLYIFVKAF